MSEIFNDLDAIERIVAPHGQSLINFYFRIVHPSFPILHKKVFLEKYSRTHREFSPPLLAAVYILTLHWWSYSTRTKRFVRCPFYTKSSRLRHPPPGHNLYKNPQKFCCVLESLYII